MQSKQVIFNCVGRWVITDQAHQPKIWPHPLTARGLASDRHVLQRVSSARLHCLPLWGVNHTNERTRGAGKACGHDFETAESSFSTADPIQLELGNLGICGERKPLLHASSCCCHILTSTPMSFTANDGVRRELHGKGPNSRGLFFWPLPEKD